MVPCSFVQLRRPSDSTLVAGFFRRPYDVRLAMRGIWLLLGWLMSLYRPLPSVTEVGHVGFSWSGTFVGLVPRGGDFYDELVCSGIQQHAGPIWPWNILCIATQCYA